MTPDKFTSAHLGDWCAAQFPRCNDATEVFSKMMAYLLELDEQEYADALESGWWKVYDQSL